MSDRDPDRTPPGSEDEGSSGDAAEVDDLFELDEELPAEPASDSSDGAEEASVEAPDDDPFEALDDAGVADPFEEMDADPETVGDEVFEMVGDEAERPSDLDIERDPAVEEVDEGVVVPKRSYCEQCPHFAEPPVVGCTNPGTTIHELVDVKQFRVSNCPVVEKQRDVRAPGE